MLRRRRPTVWAPRVPAAAAAAAACASVVLFCSLTCCLQVAAKSKWRGWVSVRVFDGELPSMLNTKLRRGTTQKCGSVWSNNWHRLLNLHFVETWDPQQLFNESRYGDHSNKHRALTNILVKPWVHGARGHSTGQQLPSLLSKAPLSLTCSTTLARPLLLHAYLYSPYF